VEVAGEWGARFVPMVSRDNAADVLGNCGGRVSAEGSQGESCGWRGRGGRGVIYIAGT